MLRKSLSKAIKYGFSIILAAIFLYISFRSVDWNDFLEGVKACGWGYVLLSMLAGGFAIYFRGLRWRELIRPLDPDISSLSTFNAVSIGNIVNLVLPRVGELIRCAFITKNSKSLVEDEESRDDGEDIGKRDKKEKGKDNEARKKASYDKVLGTVVTERAADISTLLLLVLLLSVLMWSKFGRFFIEKIFAPATSGRLTLSLGTVFLGIILLIASSISLVIFFRKKNNFCGKICTFFYGVWKGIVACTKIKKAYKFFFFNTLVWFCYWTMSYCILLAVQATDVSNVNPLLADAVVKLSTLNGVDVLFLMLAGALSSLVPVPGGFGAFHYIVGLAISTVYGVPYEIGIMFATLSHESQVITQATFGGISYGIESFRKNPL